MRTVFVLAVCAVLALTFFSACDRSPTKFDDPPDGPEDFLTPEDSAAIAKALEYIEVYGAEYGITDPFTQLRLTGVSSDSTGEASVHFEQIYEGVPVYLNFVFLRIHAHDEVELTWMTFDPDVSLDVSATPTFTEEEAIERFVNAHHNVPFMGYNQVDESGLQIRDFGYGYRLVWRLWSDSTTGNGSAEWFIDAHTGEIVDFGYIYVD